MKKQKKDTTYMIYHPIGFVMCSITINKDDNKFNKTQINEPGKKGYNPKFPRWIKLQ